jgi:hypothetical protein
MYKPEHTPGPWRIGKSGVTVIFNNDQGFTVPPVPDNDNWSEAEANARLIAAAPDLLAALELINAALPTSEKAWPIYMNDAILAARAAIRKARGEG